MRGGSGSGSYPHFRHISDVPDTIFVLTGHNPGQPAPKTHGPLRSFAILRNGWDQSMKVRRTATLLRETAADFLAGLLIIIAVFVLAAVESRTAWPAPVLLAAAPASGIVVSSHAANTPTVLDQSPAASEAAQTELRVAVGPIKSNDMPLQAAPRNRFFAISIMTLFFAAMCAVTLGFWRHIRREYASPRRK